MTTTADLVRCNRCRRVLTDPQWQAVKLGRTCAERLGLQRKRRVRAKAPRRSEIVQPVLDGLEDEIDEENREPT